MIWRNTNIISTDEFGRKSDMEYMIMEEISDGMDRTITNQNAQGYRGGNQMEEICGWIWSIYVLKLYNSFFFLKTLPNLLVSSPYLFYEYIRIYIFAKGLKHFFYYLFTHILFKQSLFKFKYICADGGEKRQILTQFK